MVQPTLEYDRSLVGKTFPAGRFEVKAELIQAFCQAVGEANPIFTDRRAARSAGHQDVVAPPTLCNLFIRGLDRPDIKLKNTRGRMHGGQAVDSLAPIHAGDSLTAVSQLKEVYTKTGRTGTMAFIVWETAFTNQHGTRVAVGRESFMARLVDPVAQGS